MAVRISKADFDRRKAATKAAIVKGLKTVVTLGKRQGMDNVEVKPPTADTVSVIKFLRGVNFGLWDGADVEKGLYRKVQTEGAGSTGGFVVPAMIVDAILPALRERAVIRLLPGVQVLPVPTAAEVEYTYEDADPAITWGTENSTISEQATGNLFGKRKLSIKRMSCLSYISRELIKDAKINMEQNVRQRMGYAAGIAETVAILQGLGGSQPMGIYYNPRVLSTDLSGSVDADTFRDAEYQVRNQNAEINAYVAHPRTGSDISKLKDANGRPIFPEVTGAGVVGPQVVSIFGKPLTQTTSISITGYPDTDETYVVGADWRQQIIGDGPMELETSTQGGDAWAKHLLGIKLVKYVGTLQAQPAAFVVIKGIQAVS